MLDACAKTARKMSAQEPCARKGRISFVWLCLHPIYSKNIKNNKTEFNFAQMTTLTVCWKRAPRQHARWAHKNWARMKAASLLYGLVYVQFNLKTWKKNNKTEFILHKWPLWLCVGGARQDSAQGERTRTERAWMPHLFCMALFTYNFLKKT